MPNIRANDGSELLNGNQFHYTKDAKGRPVLNVTASGEGNGDFMADGSVEMTGNLHMGAHAIMGVKSISDAETGLAIESEVSMNNHKITDILDPTEEQDAVTKSYLDNVVSALNTVISSINTNMTNMQQTVADLQKRIDDLTTETA